MTLILPQIGGLTFEPVDTTFTLIDAAFSTDTFDASSQTTSPVDVAFKTDGLKMYVIQSGGMFQYTLSTAWDLSTASYDSVTFNQGTAFGHYFKDDGTMFFKTATGSIVEKHTLSTAWDLSTASAVVASYDASAQSSSFRPVTFGDSGLKMYLGDVLGDDKIYQYDLTTAYDISSGVTYFGQSPASYAFTTAGMVFSPSGTTLLVIEGLLDFIKEYQLSTAWDITSGASSPIRDFDLNPPEANPRGLYIKPDGTKAFFTGNSTDFVRGIDL